MPTLRWAAAQGGFTSCISVLLPKICSDLISKYCRTAEAAAILEGGATTARGEREAAFMYQRMARTLTKYCASA
jgi:hypothetical protein